MTPSLSADTPVRALLTHPVLQPFALHLLPHPNDASSPLLLKDISRLMPWHSHVHVEQVLQGLNRLIADSTENKSVFYPLPNARSGLFFLRGKANAPFALICPGGGFRYVAILHEGLPLALVLNSYGYNAFVLQYRCDSAQSALEDLARALSWLFSHATRLQIDTKDYSLWGGSAGARLVATLASYGALAFGGNNLPKPAAVITAYTGHSIYTPADPPTFAVVSEDDPIVSVQTMQQRITALQRLGIRATLKRYQHAGHGFGTGEGSDAAGWMDDAIRFWQNVSQTQEYRYEKDPF